METVVENGSTKVVVAKESAESYKKIEEAEVDLNVAGGKLFLRLLPTAVGVGSVILDAIDALEGPAKSVALILYKFLMSDSGNVIINMGSKAVEAYGEIKKGNLTTSKVKNDELNDMVEDTDAKKVIDDYKKSGGVTIDEYGEQPDLMDSILKEVDDVVSDEMGGRGR